MYGLKSLASAVLLAGLGGKAAQAGQAEPWQITLQPAATPVMEQITSLHNAVTVVIFFITAFVFLLLAILILKYNAKANPVPAKWTHNTKLEILWTGIPVIILTVITFPSLKLLYFMDRAQNAEMTIKAVGHTWYWTYEYPDQAISFDSLMLQDNELKKGDPRLLAVDKRVVVPVDTSIRILTTSTDLIHAWAVPALGVKIDAVPGRTNETWMKVTKPGVYYGQCSELCGVNHGFMPIAVEALPKEQFQAWVAATKRAQIESKGETALANATN